MIRRPTLSNPVRLDNATVSRSGANGARLTWLLDTRSDIAGMSTTSSVDDLCKGRDLGCKIITFCVCGVCGHEFSFRSWTNSYGAGSESKLSI